MPSTSTAPASPFACLPIKEDKIKELYILDAVTKTLGQKKIPIHSFPNWLNRERLTWLEGHYADRLDLLKFG